MSGTRAAIRYAKAVLSLAVDQKTEEAVNDDMKLIATTVSENTDLDLALKNAIAKQNTKKEILNQVFPKLNPLTSKLFDVLVDNNRIDAIANVARKYNELYEAHIGKEKATVTTAVPMTEDLEIKVMAKIKELTSKSVELENIVDESIIGIGAHTDYGNLTILAQDDVGGLQVMNRDGQWVEGTPIAGTFVINIGDLLQRLTNDRYLANLHRVVNASGRERYSIPFFIDADYDAEFAPLPSCVSQDNPARYEAVTCGAHKYGRFVQSYPHLQKVPA